MTSFLAVPFLLALLQAPTPTPPPENPPPDGPVVVLTTTLGTVKIGLYKEKAPISTDNFLKYMRAGFYDGTIFHRVMPNFMAQGGGMTPDLKEKPLRPPIRNEARNGLRNSRGTVAMARTDDPNSATAQFFINVKNNHSLDFGIMGAGYTVFGVMVEGLEVVDRMVAVPTGSRGPNDNVPDVPIIIKTAREEGAPPPKPPAPKPPAGAPK